MFLCSHVLSGDLLLRLHAASGHSPERDRVPGVVDANQRHDESRAAAQPRLHPHHQHRHQHLRRGPLWPRQFPGMGLGGRSKTGHQLQCDNRLRMVTLDALTWSGCWHCLITLISPAATFHIIQRFTNWLLQQFFYKFIQRSDQKWIFKVEWWVWNCAR